MTDVNPVTSQFGITLHITTYESGAVDVSVLKIREDQQLRVLGQVFSTEKELQVGRKETFDRLIYDVLDCVGGSHGADVDELAAERYYNTPSEAVEGFSAEISERLLSDT